MSHSIKQTSSLAGGFKGSNHSGNVSPRIARLISVIQPQGFKKVNHEVINKPISVQAPATKGTPIIKSNLFSQKTIFGRIHGTFPKFSSEKKENLLTGNEKGTMKILNDRLASYLEKVRSLGQENAQLEMKIRDWYDTHKPQLLPDFSFYFATIQELQMKILESAGENTRTARRVDNARLAASDFLNKYEMEKKLRKDIEQDVNNLHEELNDLQIDIQHLEKQSQEHEQDLLGMKKRNEDVVKNLYGQVGARINVELEMTPAVELNKLLSDVREQYEQLMENNKTEAEKWFIEKSSQLQSETGNDSSEHISTLHNEIIELKRIVQTLEIDRQSQMSMNSALENTLTEKEASYSSQLSQIQGTIHDVEDTLTQIRDKQKQQSYDYKVLRDVTMHLEREITTYWSLLDKLDIHVPRPPLPDNIEVFPKGVKVLSITEEMESRKILSPRDKF
ncbi:keratin, type I cytoskeletal 19-like isoform X1 [Pelobates fuscus]|uniref:keratin, type I cytoskeletal 19-like isoform X1 n=1 Tax=Pelobates fuscus TaxID=191477 RepID=UPI002FE42F03